MTAYVTFYPLGDADSALIDLADKRKVLVDFGNQRNQTRPTTLVATSPPNSGRT